ncbi:hypothetical protein [Oenococcus sicerae]|uniref:Uncharacterized protein n=1 Tax=Oenococcus sicerae TaxID=2203724 RepID=A0AAJ1RC42_9LACO|nr:hypothetical protein [Oenococcus sicerae]MDN6900195.1 hypothetical protein [Oenococcus sicerae]
MSNVIYQAIVAPFPTFNFLLIYIPPKPITAATIKASTPVAAVKAIARPNVIEPSSVEPSNSI